MKKILFLMMAALTMTLFNACSNEDEDKEKSWIQKKTEEQEEMYEKVKTNIVGQWKEYMYKSGMTGKWTLSSEKDGGFLYNYTFNPNGICSYKEIREETGTYTIQKNPNYINENKIGSGSHCCIIVKIKQNTEISDYSALIEDDGTLKLQQVFSYLDDYREPEYTKIFKKQQLQ